MSDVSIPQETVDRMAESLFQAHVAAVMLKAGVIISRKPGSRAQDAADTIEFCVQEVILTLQRYGAKVEHLERLAEAYEVPPEQLASDANHLFLKALESAHEAGCNVIEERGYLPSVLPDLLLEMVIQVRGEISIGFERLSQPDETTVEQADNLLG